MTREQLLSKSTDVTRRYQLFDPSFIVSGTVLKGKKQFLDDQNSRNFLGDTFLKFRIAD